LKITSKGRLELILVALDEMEFLNSTLGIVALPGRIVKTPFSAICEHANWNTLVKSILEQLLVSRTCPSYPLYFNKNAWLPNTSKERKINSTTGHRKLWNNLSGISVVPSE